MPIKNNEGLDLFKPTTVKLGKKEITQKAERIIVTSNKLFLDKVKKVSESILTAKEMPRPKNLTQPQMSSNARIVLEKRYLKKDKTGKNIESPQDLYWRVASNISQADRLYEKNPLLEKTASEFYSLMAEQKFMPNSPTLRGAGRAMQQLSACFVLPIDDSLESIMTTLKNACHIFKTGGGCGYSFSRLRPRADVISTTGNNAGGPVGFMRVYNATVGEITQGGVRMGANMGMLRSDHPDIEEFISCKTDMVSLTNFNISVSADDKFMQAVEENTDYDLINPRTKLAMKKIKARDVFNKMCENAWKNGDPGMIFIDRVNNSTSNPVKSIGLVEATNPCLSKNTWVMTDQGARQIKNIIGKPTKLALDGKFYQTSSKGFFQTGIKQLYQLKTKHGYCIQATANHLIKTQSGWKKVNEITKSDFILLSQQQSLDWKGAGNFGEGYLLGLFVGNGTIKKNKAVISVWGENNTKKIKQIATLAANSLPHRADFQRFVKVKDRTESRFKLKSVYLLAKKYGLKYGHKIITPAIEQSGVKFYQGFLKAFFDSDGTIIGNLKKGISVRLSQSNLKNLYSAQRMLSRLGIISKIYPNQRGAEKKLMPDGKGGKKLYHIKSQHELVISQQNIFAFKKMVGFFDEQKSQRLKQLTQSFKRLPNKENFLSAVSVITAKKTEDVYDVEVPGVNAFEANGLIAHNCGEQPLLPNESCVLGSINLAKFVKNKTIDWDELKKTTLTAQHFLDNVIDMNRYVVPKIEQMTKSLRRTGLGVMGFADMLIKLGFAYNSPEGIQIGEKVMDFINTNARQASEKLAQKRGAYPYFKDSDDYARGSAPVRNVARTTIAPTGTISVIADCSSGIEPIFALVHKRKSIWDKDGAKIELLVVDKQFENMMREQGIYSEEIMNQISDTGSVAHNENVPEDLRKIFITAHDLEPSDHIKIQVAFQKNVDNAISKTINFPNSATIDDVKEAYLMAYQMGCKGITIYRDGSRDLQVLTVGSKDKSAGEISDAPAPSSVEPRQRPAVVVGTTEKIATGMGNLFITVNEDKEGLFEVFAQIGKSGGDAGALVEAIARMISIALRSRVPVDIIIEQLKGIRGSNPVWHNGELILSPPDALGKALERYLARQKELNLVWKNGNKNEKQSAQEVKQALEEKIEPEKNESTKVTTHKVPSTQNQINLCPECGDTMIYEEGCVKCPGCKLTKCG